MEGFNPAANCILTSCASTQKSWVPTPQLVLPRRDPLIDAVNRMEDPCHPPGRCYPCKKPVPKYRNLKEGGGCDIEKFKEEKEEAEKQACLDKWNQYYESLLPPAVLEVGILDQSNPIQFEREPPYKGRFVEVPCKTDLPAGYFNPEDNKCWELKYRERCDPACVNCRPELPIYPCRGVIEFPRLRWLSKEEEERTCFPADCKKGVCSYLSPEKLYEFKKKQEKWAREDSQKIFEEMKRKQLLHDEYMDCYSCPCYQGRCSESLNCYHPNKPNRV